MLEKRQSNIELLRILAIMGVIVLHYNNPIIGGAIKYAREDSLNLYVLYVLESIFACGVNLFMLISGYFLCEVKNRNIWKAIELVVQVIIFKEAIYFIQVILHLEPFTIKTFFAALIPNNYFVNLYCVVFLLSPFINILIDKLTIRNLRTLVLLSMIFFSIIPTVVDVLGELRGKQILGLSTIGLYGSQWGYSIVNFMLMYLIGAYLKKEYNRLIEIDSRKLITFFVINTLLLVVWARGNDSISILTERSAWEYCNPLIICEAAAVFILFGRINLGMNKTINYLANGVFTVFLLHGVFIPHLQIQKYVTGSTVPMILHIVVCMVGIYVACWCIHA